MLFTTLLRIAIDALMEHKLTSKTENRALIKTVWKGIKTQMGARSASNSHFDPQ